MEGNWSSLIPVIENSTEISVSPYMDGSAEIDYGEPMHNASLLPDLKLLPKLSLKQSIAMRMMLNVSSRYNCAATDAWEWDVSEVPYLGDKETTVWDRLSRLDPVNVVMFFAYVLVSLLALVGNTAVIVLIILMPSLRTTMNYYLANLAVSGILVGSFCVWILLANGFAGGTDWILGAFFCKINGFIQMATLTASTLTLTAVAIDRLWAVKYPFRIRRQTCVSRGKIIGCIWAAAVLAATPFLIYRLMVVIQWADYTEVQCVETWPRLVAIDGYGRCHFDDVWRRAYYTLITVAMYFLPLTVMAVCYYWIGVVVWKSRVPGSAEVSLHAATNGITAANDTRRQERRNKVIRMSFIVMLVFCICWTPLQFCTLYTVWVHDRSRSGPVKRWFEIVEMVSYFLAYANSAINPILYGSLNSAFREAAMRRRQVTMRNVSYRQQNRSAVTSTTRMVVDNRRDAKTQESAV